MRVKEIFRHMRRRFAAAPLILTGPAICLAVGMLSGCAAALLKWIIGHMPDLMLGFMDIKRGNPILIILPVAGIALTGLFSRYVLRRNIGHSSDKIRDNLKKGDIYISPKLTYGPVIASSLTLGFGGSAGSAGPIATVGAAIGGVLSNRLGLPPHMVRTMIGCGAAAGIAGIFKAPVGGLLFILECMGLQMSALAITGTVATCVTASLTAHILSGSAPDLALPGQFSCQDYGHIPAVALLGLLCGIYALYYRYSGNCVQRRLQAIHSTWLRNIVSGATVGILLFMFPSLYGEGYGVIDNIINSTGYSLGDYSPLYFLTGTGEYGMLLIASGILLVKGAAAFATTGGGGVAGDFAPTLFAGAISGYVFVLAAHAISGMQLPPQVFILCGMAAVMAGVLKAPMMAVFITVEMASCYEYFLPVIIAGSISFAVVKTYDCLRKRSL